MNARTNPRWPLIAVSLAGLMLVGVIGWSLSEPDPAAEPEAPPDNRPPAAPSTEAPSAAGAPAAVEVPALGKGAPVAARKVAQLGWGTGPNQLGRRVSQDEDDEGHGHATGPMSLAADGRGNTLVLDQVNQRAVRLGKDGSVAATFPLTQSAPVDVAVGPQGQVAVLDASGDSTVAIHGEDGRLLGTVPLIGEGLDDDAAATGVLIEGDDVFVEKENGPWVKVGTTDGKPASSRPQIPGRPSRDGRYYLSAGISEDGTERFFLSVTDRGTGNHRFTREYRTARPLISILLVDSDRAGTAYVAALVDDLQPGAPAESEGEQTLIHLFCLDPTSGNLLGQAELPPPGTHDETFRDLAVLDDGGVLYAHRTAAGITYQRITCR